MPLIAIALVTGSVDTSLALSGLIVGCMVFLAVAKPEAGTAVVVFLTYLNISGIAARKHLPEALAGASLVLLAVPVFKYVFLRGQKVTTNSVLGLMVVNLAVMLLSTSFASHPERSVDKIVTYVAEGVLLYFLVINAVRTREVLRRVIWVMLIAGSLLGTLSMAQKVIGPYKTSFGGLAQVTSAKVGTGTTDWDGSQVTDRSLGGPIGEKNYYAQIMVVLLPLAICQSYAERSRRMRRLALVAAAPIFAGMTLAYSRGALVALAVTLAVMISMRVVKVSHVVGFGVAATVLAVVVSPVFVYRVAGSRIWSGNVSGADTSVKSRLTENLASLKIFADHPVLGVGPDQARFYTAKYDAGDGLERLVGLRRSHNMYLATLANTGVIGFAAFALLLFVGLKNLLRARALARVGGDAALGHGCTGLFLALVAYLAASIFLDLAYERYFWLLLALAGAAAQIVCAAPARVRIVPVLRQQSFPQPFSTGM